MREELEGIFGGRATFDKVERMLYSHDVANLPAAVEKMVLKTADAVVQPETADEVVELVKVAAQKEFLLPLEERGQVGMAV